MHKSFAILVAAATLAACGRGSKPTGDAAASPQNEGAPTPPPAPADDAIDEPHAPHASADSPVRLSPCLMQDGKPLQANGLRAIGTEPFWGARIEGRCVTYSTPEDQAGTRIWTRFSGTAENGTWSGALGGRRFELKTSPDPRCSDGMSDNIYPIAVTLLVSGEERRGCAEPRK